MTNVTCGLTAKKPGSAPSPTVVIESGNTLPQETHKINQFYSTFLALVAFSADLFKSASLRSFVTTSSLKL